MNKKFLSILILAIFVFLVFGSYISNADIYDSDDYYSDYGQNDYGYTSSESDAYNQVFLVLIIIIVVMILVYIVLCTFIYFDAKKRGENPWIWVLIVILSAIVGIIVWLVVRPPVGGKPDKKYNNDPFSNRYNNYSNGRMCPNCGRFIQFDAKFCPYCTKQFNDFL